MHNSAAFWKHLRDSVADHLPSHKLSLMSGIWRTIDCLIHRESALLYISQRMSLYSTPSPRSPSTISPRSDLPHCSLASLHLTRNPYLRHRRRQTAANHNPLARPRYLGRRDNRKQIKRAPRMKVLSKSPSHAIIRDLPDCVRPSFRGSMPVPAARMPYMGGAWRKVLNKRHASRV